MPVREWDPLRDLLSLQERMNRLFEESLVRLDPPLLASSTWTPLADVHETEGGFVVQVELPGLRRSDIEVSVDSEQLMLRGKRKMARPARPDRFHRMERSYGPYSRAFRFPVKVDPDRVTTRFEDTPRTHDTPPYCPRSCLARQSDHRWSSGGLA